jgi:hypothetical protein
MAKENISATVDPEVSEYLDQAGRNKSETINQAVKAYMESGGNERAMLELRQSQLESEKRTKENELENVKEELTAVRERLDELRTEAKEDKQESWDRALSMLRFSEFASTDNVMIDSPDEAVEDFAEDLGLSVDDFRTELKRRYKNQ